MTGSQQTGRLLAKRERAVARPDLGNRLDDLAAETLIDPLGLTSLGVISLGVISLGVISLGVISLISAF